MKRSKIFFTAIFSLYVLAGFGNAMADATTPAVEVLDYNKINAQIAGLVPALILNDAVVSQANISFDPQFTDLPHDKIKIILSTDLKSTGWSKNLTSFTTAVSAQATNLGEGEDGKITGELGVDLNVKTETLAMLRFLPSVARDMANCDPDPTAPGSVFCVKLTELESVQDLEALVVWLNNFQTVILKRSDEKLAKLQTALAAAHSQVEHDSIQSQLDHENSMKNLFSQLQVTTETDGTHLTKVSVGPKDASKSINFPESKVEITTILLNATSDVLHIGFGVKLNEIMNTSSYLSFKGNIVQSLEKFQASDPDAIATVKNDVQTYISLLKGWTNQ